MSGNDEIAGHMEGFIFHLNIIEFILNHIFIENHVRR